MSVPYQALEAPDKENQSSYSYHTNIYVYQS